MKKIETEPRETGAALVEAMARAALVVPDVTDFQEPGYCLIVIDQGRGSHVQTNCEYRALADLLRKIAAKMDRVGDEGK